MRRFKIDASSNGATLRQFWIRNVDAVLIVKVFGVVNCPRRFDGGAVGEPAGVNVRMVLRSLVEFVQLIQPANSQDCLRVRKALAISARKCLERPNPFPEIFREVSVADERQGRTDRISPPREAFRTDERPRCHPKSESLDQFRRALQWLGFGLRAHLGGNGRIICHSHTTAVRVDALQHLKTEKGRLPERSDAAAATSRTRSLGAILDDDEIVLLGNAHDFSHRAGLAVEMRRHDRPRAFGNRCFDSR